jgi:hypothetical protein
VKEITEQLKSEVCLNSTFKTHCFSITKTKWLIMFSEIIAGYVWNHTNLPPPYTPTQTLWENYSAYNVNVKWLKSYHYCYNISSERQVTTHFYKTLLYCKLHFSLETVLLCQIKVLQWKALLLFQTLILARSPCFYRRSSIVVQSFMKHARQGTTGLILTCLTGSANRRTDTRRKHEANQ